MNRKKTKLPNLSLLKLFIVVLLFLISVSIIYKGFLLFNKRSFRDESYSFLLKTKSKAYLLNVNKEYKKFSILSINREDYDLSNFSILKNSINLGIVLDGMVVMNNQDLNDVRNELFSLTSLFSILTSQKKIILLKMNEFDLINTYFFIKTLNNYNISQIRYSEIDKENNEILKNNKIIDERKDIEIDNGTEIDGLAGKVSNMMRREGFNVVLAKSVDESEKSKIIIYGGESYVSKRIEQIFPFPIERREEKSIADVVIVIGKDMDKVLDP